MLGVDTSLCLRFLFLCYLDHRLPHSFPTRRSSDLATALCHRMRSGKPASPRFLNATSWNAFDRLLVPKNLGDAGFPEDRKSTRLNSSHVSISYAVFCLKKKSLQTIVC